RRSGGIGNGGQLRRSLRERRCQRVDEVERRELIRGASGRVTEIAVERADLETERAAGGLVMALQALRLAWEFPGLTVHRDGFAAHHTRRVRALGVPFVRVARPSATVVAHEQ